MAPNGVQKQVEPPPSCPAPSSNGRQFGPAGAGLLRLQMGEEDGWPVKFAEKPQRRDLHMVRDCTKKVYNYIV